MNEENNNNIAGAENIDNNAALTANEQTAPQTFTQDDVNRILDTRLKREQRRVEKQYKDYDGFKQIFTTLKENGVIKTDNIEEAVSDIKRFYAREDGDTVGDSGTTEPKRTAAVLPQEQKLALVEYSTSKFVENSTFEDIEDEYETLRSMGKRRTDEEDVKFGVIAKKYEEIKTKKAAERQLEDFRSKYPKVNIDELKAHEEFKKFAQISRVPLVDTYEFYLSAKGVAPAAKRDLGTVASQGVTTEKDLLTPEQLQKLTPDEIAQNRDLVRKSILANVKKT